MMMQDRLDVFWGTAHALPLGYPSTVTKCLTVYDLTWRLFPETMSRSNYYMHRLFTDRSIREADSILVISKSAAQDLQQFLHVKADKIHLIYPGVCQSYQPCDPAAASQYIAQQFQVSEGYLLATGTVEPRKNLTILIEAMKILRDLHDFHRQLLIVGGAGWKDSKIYASVKDYGLTDREVKFLGHVPEKDLPLFYSGASLFVFPSLYEGFGLPLVEAMACGAPIVASEIPAVSEVVQDAAILFPPRDPRVLAETILRVSHNPDLRQRMIQTGLQRARQFRWDKAAQETLRALTGSPRAPGEHCTSQ